MNTDENMETPGGLRISAIPTVLIFHKGEEVGTALGRRQSRDQVPGGAGQAGDLIVTCRRVPRPARRRPIDPAGGARPSEDLRVSHPGVLVKICGLTCVEDAVGLRRDGGRLDRPQLPSPVAPLCRRRSSPRRSSPRSRGRSTAVGVFVDRPPAEVAEVADRLGPRHRAVARPGTRSKTWRPSRRFRVIRAFRLRTAEGWKSVSRIPDAGRGAGPSARTASWSMLTSPACPGGTGTSIDHATCSTARPPCPA